eukprot:Rmarinus@m.12621
MADEAIYKDLNIYAAEEDEIVGEVVAEKRHANLKSSYVNMANGMLGSGMLGLPYAVSRCGTVTGSIVMVMSALAAFFGLHLLSICAVRLGGTNTSYYAVAQRTIPRLTYLVDFAVAIKCMGSSISYVIVMGDLLKDSMRDLFDMDDDSILRDRHFWITLLVFTLVTPLASLRRMDSLKFTSLLAVFAVLYVMFLVWAYYSIPAWDACGNDDDDSCKGDYRAFDWDLQTISAISIFVFGFTCHQNIFVIYNELKTPSLRRMDIVMALSVFSVFILYSTVAMFGYLTFGEEVEANVLDSYPSDNVVTIGRLAVALLVIFSFPLQSHAARNSILQMYAIFRKQTYEADLSNPLVEEEGAHAKLALRTWDKNYWAATAIVVLFPYGIAMAVSDLGVILSLVGATGGASLCYIFPAIFYLELERNQAWHAKHYLACVMGIAGILLMLVTI